MKRALLTLTFLTALMLQAVAQPAFPKSEQEDTEHIMSAGYWKHWNPEVQAEIDRNIEAYRKADAVVNLPDAARGTEVKVEQLTSAFQFGGILFMFNQLGSKEANQKYKDTFGKLFNRATIPFYWRSFETSPGRLRFSKEYWDSEEWWNNCATPTKQPHWRKPSSDQLVEWCEEHGIAVHGHPLIWGSRKVYPEWHEEYIAGEAEGKALDSMIVARGINIHKESDVFNDEYNAMTPTQLASRFPNLAANIGRVYDERIRRIAEYYGDRIPSWDVVNESCTDWSKGNLIPGDSICKSHYGLMPGDYVYRAFDVAAKLFSKKVTLAINDYWTDYRYGKEVAELLKRGARIDCIGLQMHTFKAKDAQRIADGADYRTPKLNMGRLSYLDSLDIPLHLSEITIPAPDSSLRSEKIQAIIAYNCYRQWFSVKNMTAITWWNLVDGGGSSDEILYSGIYTPDMKPKQVYHALDRLINHEWRTNTTVKAERGGVVRFRGFRGNYRISYTDRQGNRRVVDYQLK